MSSDVLWILFRILGGFVGLPVGMLLIMIMKTGSVRGGRIMFMGIIARPIMVIRCKLTRKSTDDHIVAYKWAYPIVKDSQGMFRPLRWGNLTYTADDTAVCKHKPRLVHCNCGFHALKFASHLGYVSGSYPNIDDSAVIGFCATLEVDLSGAVIMGELGYRAEKQRVLKVLIPRYCWYHDANALVSRWKRRFRPATGVCISTRDFGGEEVVVPVCDDCRPTAKPLSWLANQLGTEVAWTTKRPVI